MSTTLPKSVQAARVPPESEKQFQAAVVQLARLHRWRCYHTHDSRRSESGFPDLVLIREPEILYVELKTEKGRLSKAQEGWLNALTYCNQKVYVWRPSQKQEIADILRGALRSRGWEPGA